MRLWERGWRAHVSHRQDIEFCHVEKGPLASKTVEVMGGKRKGRRESSLRDVTNNFRLQGLAVTKYQRTRVKIIVQSVAHKVSWCSLNASQRKPKIHAESKFKQVSSFSLYRAKHTCTALCMKKNLQALSSLLPAKELQGKIPLQRRAFWSSPNSLQSCVWNFEIQENFGMNISGLSVKVASTLINSTWFLIKLRT